ncbi:hypothetical protein IWZ03DRAFT_234191 [Phyllosticta citriasiana]|uniref:Uncharacterized protein n=1 Tax=Phyllosticta citriasiana TaxID=595635 RepID=A0ABR1KN01_9PEZI
MMDQRRRTDGKKDAATSRCGETESKKISRPVKRSRQCVYQKSRVRSPIHCTCMQCSLCGRGRGRGLVADSGRRAVCSSLFWWPLAPATTSTLTHHHIQTPSQADSITWRSALFFRRCHSFSHDTQIQSESISRGASRASSPQLPHPNRIPPPPGLGIPPTPAHPSSPLSCSSSRLLRLASSHARSTLS